MSTQDGRPSTDEAGDLATPPTWRAAPAPLRSACAVLGLEALGLLALAAFIIFDTIAGDPHSVPGALLGAALTFVGALGILAGARGLLFCRPAARTPIVVVQVLAIPVAYSLGFQAGRIAYGGPILVAALLVIYLLFTPPSRAALDRDPPV